MSPLTPSEKSRLEARNCAAQLDYISYVLSLGRDELRVSDVLELQRLAVEGIYNCGGSLRDARTVLTIGHQAPEAALAGIYLDDMVATINKWKGDRQPYELSGYAMWRLNWIHPFRGGNGRTSRAVACLLLAQHARIVSLLTGFPGHVLADRDAYIRMLREVDANVEDNPNSPDLTPARRYVYEIVLRTIETSGIAERARRTAKAVGVQEDEMGVLENFLSIPEFSSVLARMLFEGKPSGP